MKNHFANEYIRIWTDDVAPIIFSRVIKQAVPTEFFEQLSVIQLNLLKQLRTETNEVFSVCDASGLQVYSFDLLVNDYSHRLPQQVEAGLLFSAFVIPNSLTLADQVDIEKCIGHLPVAFFMSTADALQYVNQEMKKTRDHACAVNGVGI
jgi:hypothetical protein